MCGFETVGCDEIGVEIVASAFESVGCDEIGVGIVAFMKEVGVAFDVDVAFVVELGVAFIVVGMAFVGGFGVACVVEILLSCCGVCDSISCPMVTKLTVVFCVCALEVIASVLLVFVLLNDVGLPWVVVDGVGLDEVVVVTPAAVAKASWLWALSDWLSVSMLFRSISVLSKIEMLAPPPGSPSLSVLIVAPTSRD